MHGIEDARVPQSVLAGMQEPGAQKKPRSILRRPSAPPPDLAQALPQELPPQLPQQRPEKLRRLPDGSFVGKNGLQLPFCTSSAPRETTPQKKSVTWNAPTPPGQGKRQSICFGHRRRPSARFDVLDGVAQAVIDGKAQDLWPRYRKWLHERCRAQGYYSDASHTLAYLALGGTSKKVRKRFWERATRASLHPRTMEQMAMLIQQGRLDVPSHVRQVYSRLPKDDASMEFVRAWAKVASAAGATVTFSDAPEEMVWQLAKHPRRFTYWRILLEGAGEAEATLLSATRRYLDRVKPSLDTLEDYIRISEQVVVLDGLATNPWRERACEQIKQSLANSEGVKLDAYITLVLLAYDMQVYGQETLVAMLARQEPARIERFFYRTMGRAYRRWSHRAEHPLFAALSPEQRDTLALAALAGESSYAAVADTLETIERIVTPQGRLAVAEAAATHALSFFKQGDPRAGFALIEKACRMHPQAWSTSPARAFFQIACQFIENMSPEEAASHGNLSFAVAKLSICFPSLLTRNDALEQALDARALRMWREVAPHWRPSKLLRLVDDGAAYAAEAMQILEDRLAKNPRLMALELMGKAFDSPTATAWLHRTALAWVNHEKPPESIEEMDWAHAHGAEASVLVEHMLAKPWLSTSEAEWAHKHGADASVVARQLLAQTQRLLDGHCMSDNAGKALSLLEHAVALDPAVVRGSEGRTLLDCACAQVVRHHAPRSQETWKRIAALLGGEAAMARAFRLAELTKLKGDTLLERYIHARGESEKKLHAEALAARVLAGSFRCEKPGMAAVIISMWMDDVPAWRNTLRERLLSPYTWSSSQSWDVFLTLGGHVDETMVTEMFRRLDREDNVEEAVFWSNALLRVAPAQRERIDEALARVRAARERQRAWQLNHPMRWNSRFLCL